MTALINPKKHLDFKAEKCYNKRAIIRLSEREVYMLRQSNKITVKAVIV